MAKRPIQARRPTPYQLYLLIAFVVLALAFAILFAWMYSLWNTEQQRVFGLARIEQARQSEGANVWADLIKEYPEADQQNLVDVLNARRQLAEDYRSEIHLLLQQLVGDPYRQQSGSDLRQTVSGSRSQTTELLAEVKQALQRSYQLAGGAGEGADISPTSVHAGFRALMKRIDALVGQVGEDAKAIAQLQGQISTLRDELAAAKQEFARQVAQIQANADAEKKRLEDARDSAVRTSNDLQTKLRELQDKILAERRDHRATEDKGKQENFRLQSELGKVAGELKEYKRPPQETGVDGTVIRVSEFGGVAYADVGKKDGILLGLPFAVFSQAAMGLPDAVAKAEARIVRVLESSSELRIYSVTSPVVAGDVLVNLVYDRQRRLSFRLIGKIDMDDDGLDDTERLKGLIQQFGGRVDEQLAVQTDYLITGEEPPVLAPPPADAAASERDRYERSRRAFLEFSGEMVKAQNYGIPVLSLNRFLGLVGIAGRQ
jgi:outer membrane murein-binding lipoprotein Lpp